MMVRRKGWGGRRVEGRGRTGPSRHNAHSSCPLCSPSRMSYFSACGAIQEFHDPSSKSGIWVHVMRQVHGDMHMICAICIHRTLHILAPHIGCPWTQYAMLVTGQPAAPAIAVCIAYGRLNADLGPFVSSWPQMHLRRTHAPSYHF